MYATRYAHRSSVRLLILVNAFIVTTRSYAKSVTSSTERHVVVGVADEVVQGVDRFVACHM
jgi:hypothetical protein